LLLLQLLLLRAQRSAVAQLATAASLEDRESRRVSRRPIRLTAVTTIAPTHAAVVQSPRLPCHALALVLRCQDQLVLLRGEKEKRHRPTCTRTRRSRVG
jgi:hypothetical protein